MHTVPKANGPQCKPYYKLFRTMNLHNEMYCSKNVEKLVTYKVDKARDHMIKIELNRV